MVLFSIVSAVVWRALSARRRSSLPSRLFRIYRSIKTKRGISVAAEGGTLRIVYAAGDLFARDSDDVLTAGCLFIEDVARRIKDDPEIHVFVNGFTSEEGTEELNRNLSGRRAVKAAGIITAAGIAPVRALANGMGDVGIPVAGGRALRTVELVLYEVPGIPR